MMVNGKIVSNGYFNSGEIVFESCIIGLQTVAFKNPLPNDWTGTVIVTKDGRATSIRCEPCSGDSYSGNIYINGNSESSDLSSDQCMAGNTCAITWFVQGKNTNKLFFLDIKRV